MLEPEAERRCFRTTGIPTAPQFRWHTHKPFYALKLWVIELRILAGQSILGRLYGAYPGMGSVLFGMEQIFPNPELRSKLHVECAHVNNGCEAFRQ
jgi:hypothetical protein